MKNINVRGVFLIFTTALFTLQSVGSLTKKDDNDHDVDYDNDGDDDVFSDCVEVLGVCRLVKAKCTA